jgi:hypothetical protein
MVKNFVLMNCLILTFGLTACANQPAESIQSIATVQPGDKQLTCKDITSQMAEMDRITNTPVDAGLNVGSTAAQTVLGFVPVVGSLVGAGLAVNEANNASSQAQQQMSRQVQAGERKSQLLVLYNKKC